MGMELAINSTPATVTSVNNRTEKHGEDELVIGQDLDLWFIADVDVLKLFNVEQHEPPNWRDFLFSEEGIPIALGMKPFASTLKFDEHVVTISYMHKGRRTKKKFIGARLKKFTFEPQPKHNLRVGVQIQLHPQDGETMGWLVQMLVDGDANVKIEPPKQRDAFSDADKSREKEPDKAAA